MSVDEAPPSSEWGRTRQERADTLGVDARALKFHWPHHTQECGQIFGRLYNHPCSCFDRGERR